jgi:hypothetical protein
MALTPSRFVKIIPMYTVPVEVDPAPMPHRFCTPTNILSRSKEKMNRN